MRKTVGLPATYEVGVLADMINRLRDAVRGQIFHDLDAMVTWPELNALYTEDVLEAMEYARVLPSRNLDPWNVPQELATVFAGNGLGLCRNPWNQVDCHEEQLHMPVLHVLSLSFSEDSLTLALRFIKQPVRNAVVNSMFPGGQALTDESLGLRSLRTNYIGREELFWRRVGAQIITLALRDFGLERGGQPIDLALPHGEGIVEFEHQIRAMLDNTTTHLQGKTSRIQIHPDPMFLTARGAAEIARRPTAHAPQAEWEVD